MTIQSSYIFLENPYKKEAVSQNAASSSATLKLRKSVTRYLTTSFANTQRVDGYGNFYKRKYTTDITCGKYACKAYFVVTVVVDTTYLDIIVEGKSKPQLIACLDYIQAQFLSSGVREYYIDIVSYDAVSEYYCNKGTSKNSPSIAITNKI